MHADALEVVWTEVGVDSLTEAHSHIAAVNPRAADDLIASIRLTVAQLSRQPGLGFRSKIRQTHGLVRELFVAPYRILYRPEPKNKRVLILLVWHASRRNPSTRDFLPPLD